MVCVSGCVTYSRPNTTEAEYNRDRTRCEYEAALATPDPAIGSLGASVANGFATGMRQNELIRLCLQSRGYSAK